MDRGSRRAVLGVLLIVIGVFGYVTLHGYLWPLIALGGLFTLVYGWAAGGANDMYGERSKYPVAEDLRRADDEDSTPPHPGPFPPQGPNW